MKAEERLADFREHGERLFPWSPGNSSIYDMAREAIALLRSFPASQVELQRGVYRDENGMTFYDKWLYDRKQYLDGEGDG